jgi:pimeloyl-ACP methyl ester carboxylesterase
MAFTTKELSVRGLNFHVVDEGKLGDPVVLLLHGFPDSSDLWRYQIPALVDEGYRVIAPDLCGFGQSSKPTKETDYEWSLLAGDVLGILAELGIGEFHLVGHDWGALLGWILTSYMSPPRNLALTPPAIANFLGTQSKLQIKSLTALSVGHPQAYKVAPLEQREKSWYILFFLFHRAEFALPANEYQLLRLWSGNQKEADQWITHFESNKPANLLAALNWYRVNTNPERSIADKEFPPIRVPTYGIWSSNDPHQTETPMKSSGTFVDNPDERWRYQPIADAGHWMQLDRPDIVNRLLLEWLEKGPTK